MNQTVVKVNPPRRASAASVSTWLQLSQNYKELARRAGARGEDRTILDRLARECGDIASRLAAVQCVTTEVVDGVMRDIKALAAERAERWQAPRMRL